MRMPTLQELANALCEDEAMDYVLLTSEKTSVLEKIVVGDATSIYAKMKAYPYEYEINNFLKIVSVDGVSNNNDEVKILKSGDYVDYPVEYTNVDTYYSPGVAYGAVATDTGWRVAYNSNGVIKIITAGVPTRIKLDETAGSKIIDPSNYIDYLDSELGQSVIGGLSLEEVQTYNIDWLEASNDGVEVLSVLTNQRSDGYLEYYYTGGSELYMGAGSGIEVGVRPVVTLKDKIVIISGKGTKAEPYVLGFGTE